MNWLSQSSRVVELELEITGQHVGLNNGADGHNSRVCTLFGLIALFEKRQDPVCKQKGSNVTGTISDNQLSLGKIAYLTVI